MKNKTTLLIMAAGMGSRFGSLKQITPLGTHKKTLLHYTIHDAVNAGFDKIVFIIRQSFENEFKKIVGKYSENLIETLYCYQDLEHLPNNMPPIKREKPWGTAHAIWCAKEFIKEPFAVLNADDFYGSDSFIKAHDFLTSSQKRNEYALIGYQLSQTLSENGTVSRGICNVDDKGYLKSIIERTKIGNKKDNCIFDFDKKIMLNAKDVVSMNFWAFTPQIFSEIEEQFMDFYPLNKDNLKSEFYIPTVVDTSIKQNKIQVKVITTSDKWFGITYKEDTPSVNEALEDFSKRGKYKDL